MNADEVRKLATLARIDILESEAETLSGEFEAILGYVSEVKKMAHPSQTLPLARGGQGGVHNVMRADADPHESVKFSEAILKNAPARESDYIKVKKIL